VRVLAVSALSCLHCSRRKASRGFGESTGGLKMDDSETWSQLHGRKWNAGDGG